MPNAQEEEVIRRLRERAARGDPSGVEVSYRVAGGAPGEQLVDEELRLFGTGPVHARLRTTATTSQESSQSLAEPEMTSLLREISDGVDELIPQSEARFVPDSIVGKVSVAVDGQRATFYFLPDAEQAKQHGRPLRARAACSVEALDRLHKRILPR